MPLPVMVPGCARACWIKPIPPQASGQTRRIARKPTKTSWKSRALSQRSTGKSRISSPCPATSSGPTQGSGDPVACRACLCRSEIANGSVRPNCRYHPGHHEDRPCQYCLQHAPLPLPRKIERERVVLPLAMDRDLLKTQSESHPRNPQSKRQKTKIIRQSHQQTVLRSLHLVRLIFATKVWTSSTTNNIHR